MKSSKFTVIDLFSGCGGLSEGFKLAGYEIVGGIDFNKSAIETFSKNFPNAKAICCDLLDINEQKIIDIFGEKIKNVDVVIGGPPCQGFSSANRYQDTTNDPRNKLFFEFVKFVDLIKPKAIVIENVRGIVTSNNGYARKKIEEIFEQRNYSVVHKILNASDFGIPQNRCRNFFVMLKNGAKFDFEKLEKSNNYITVLEAIGELYDFEKSDNNNIKKINKTPNTNFQKYLRSDDNVIYNHDIKYPAEIVQKRISYVKQGENWTKVPVCLWPTNRNNRHSSAYKRLDENKPSCTIDTGNNHSNYFHPLYNRIPTVREAARLQSFPDDFIFYGNRSEQYRQVGNAVPPLLSKAIAHNLMKVLIDEE